MGKREDIAESVSDIRDKVSDLEASRDASKRGGYPNPSLTTDKLLDAVVEIAEVLEQLVTYVYSKEHISDISREISSVMRRTRGI